MQNNEQEQIEGLKVVILGDSSVGKSSIAHRYINNEFSNKIESTIGSCFLSKDIKIQNKKYRLNIWDTAGQEQYRSLASIYYKDAQIAIIVFDINNEQTYKSIQYWKSNVEKNSDESIIIIIVGNKIDLQSTQQIENIQQNINCDFIKCSAKDNINIEKIFESSVQNYIKNIGSKKQNFKNNSVQNIKAKKKRFQC